MIASSAETLHDLIVSTWERYADVVDAVEEAGEPVEPMMLSIAVPARFATEFAKRFEKIGLRARDGLVRTVRIDERGSTALLTMGYWRA